ncbi:MAG: hypothetical protein ACKO35_16000, partial [Planctomycetaceae bacterium]
MRTPGISHTAAATTITRLAHGDGPRAALGRDAVCGGAPRAGAVERGAGGGGFTAGHRGGKATARGRQPADQ